jgi:hypothetical protein
MSEAHRTGDQGQMGDAEEGAAVAPVPRQRTVPESPTTKIKPEAVVQRLWRAADRQIAESERRMEADADEAIEREARTLSMLGKLVRELTEINLPTRGRTARHKSRAARPQAQDVIEFNGEFMHGDAVDVERFRAALAQRLELLQGQRASGAIVGDLQPGGA